MDKILQKIISIAISAVLITSNVIPWLTYTCTVYAGTASIAAIVKGSVAEGYTSVYESSKADNIDAAVPTFEALTAEVKTGDKVLFVSRGQTHIFTA